MLKTEPMGTEKKVDSDNYFVVKGWMWNPKDQDYTLERPELTQTHEFGEFVAAADYFDYAEHENAPGEHRTDVKLQLIHYRFGTPHIVKSRILVP